ALCPGIRASRNQKHRRTRYRPPDRRGPAIPSVAITVVSEESLERRARIGNGADGQWSKAARVYTFFCQRCCGGVGCTLDRPADSTGVVISVRRIVRPRPDT